MENQKRVSLAKAIKASIDNGERLLWDATLLHYPEHAPTVYALVALAQEEYAKAFLLYLVESNCIPWDTKVRQTLNDHKAKQLIGLVLDFLNPDDDDFEEFLKNLSQEGFRIPFHVQDAIHLFRYEKIDKDYYSEPNDNPYHPLAKKVSEGGYDKLKQDAIYVNIGRTGEVINEPNKKISFELAKLEYAKAKRFSRVLQYENGQIEIYPSYSYQRISLIFKVLFKIITIEEFNQLWENI